MSLRSNAFSVGGMAMVLALASACGGDDGTSGSGGAGGSSTGSTPSGSTSTGTNPTNEMDLEGALDSMTLTADTKYTLKGVVTVGSGKTLTIEPGTLIVGDKASKGTLVIQQGAKIEAVGTAEAPIVFTSAVPAGNRKAGDWGGLVILGKAPINEPGNTAAVEGFETMQTYGGTDPDDSSGTLEYVRIEFSGIEIAPDNEINGLTLAGVGRGTKIDFVQVRNTLDDCFEFFGGTVDAKHLVCHRNGDDGFDFDQGYVGKLQYLFLQQDPNVADDANGFESDNDKDAPDVAPVTNPTVSNVTLCGQNGDQAKQQFGFLFRRGFNATISNAYVTGFEAAVDFRDVPPTSVDLTSSVFVGNVVENIAYVETADGADQLEDDDSGFDEVAWFNEGEGNLTEAAALGDCFAETPNPTPSAEIPGATPPSGLDASAAFIGAFRDASDNWLEGWTAFTPN